MKLEKGLYVPEARPVKDVEADETVYVNLYQQTRHYGGPQEGGWYYDLDECKLTLPTLNRENMIKTLMEFCAEFARKHELFYGNISSVLGGAEAWVCVEKTPAESENLERPHYE